LPGLSGGYVSKDKNKVEWFSSNAGKSLWIPRQWETFYRHGLGKREVRGDGEGPTITNVGGRVFAFRWEKKRKSLKSTEIY